MKKLLARCFVLILFILPFSSFADDVSIAEACKAIFTFKNTKLLNSTPEILTFKNGAGESLTLLPNEQLEFDNVVFFEPDASSDSEVNFFLNDDKTIAVAELINEGADAPQPRDSAKARRCRIKCLNTLPTPDYGTSFFRCYNKCMGF